MWYTRREQLLRSALWYSCSGGANLIVPVISFGMGQITGGKLASWQYMYLLAGILTFVWCFLVLVYMPDNPNTARGFSTEERDLIAQRMKEDNVGMLNRDFKPRQVLECLMSLNFWSVNLMSLLTSVTAGPISSFGSIIFNDMGFTPKYALLLNLPNGALAFFCILTSAYLGRRFPGLRHYLIMLGCPLVVIGACIVYVVRRLTSFHNGYSLLTGGDCPATPLVVGSLDFT